MLNANLWMSNQVEERKSSRAKVLKAQAPADRKKAALGTTRQPPNRLKKNPTNEDDDAFHYVAYVPVRGDVWKFDGLLKQPTNLGK